MSTFAVFALLVGLCVSSTPALAHACIMDEGSPGQPPPAEGEPERLRREVARALREGGLGEAEIERRVEALSGLMDLPPEETKLTPSDADAGDSFGTLVAIDGDRLVVSAFGDDNKNGEGAGAVYVYDYDGTSWQETKIIASDGDPGDFFGNSVALSGDRLVVGASHDYNENTEHAGTVYVYDYDGTSWQETKIIASDGTQAAFFGSSVAVSGDRLVVAPITEGVYVYDYDGTSWVETKIILSDGDPSEFVGISVVVSGDRLVVGAPSDDNDNGSEAGSAYVYDYDGTSWVETKIIASDGDPQDYFGTSVALTGDRLIVGAFSDDNDNGIHAGAVYVYDYDGASWQETKIIASDGDPGDFFGAPVALSGDRLVVGAPNDDNDNGTDAGTTYVYDYDGTSWQETKIVASDGDPDDFFGAPVALSGDRLVVGVPGDDNDNGTDAGTVYVYDYDDDASSLTFSREAGPPGLAVSLYGEGFSGATQVLFNRTPAEFTIESDTEITAIVPEGASDGPIRVRIEGEPPLVSKESFNVTSGEERIRGEGTYRYANKAYGFSFSAEYTSDLEPGEPGYLALAGHLRVERRRFLFEATRLQGLQVEEGPCGPCTAWLTGEGRYNGSGGYAFLLAVMDGRPDRLRLRIWDAESGDLVYDTEPKAPEDAPPSRKIAQGQIIVDNGVGADKQADAVAESEVAGVPSAYALLKNYPNPFNPETVLPFELPEASEVVIRVYDVLGREVAVLAAGRHEAGRHEVRWRADGMPTGLYVVRMEAAGQAFTQTVMLMK